jgi:hypothetical protein
MRDLTSKTGSIRSAESDELSVDDGVDDRLYRQWRKVRFRLIEALDGRGGLAAPLAAYAIDHEGVLRLDEVVALRAEYGIDADPPAEELMPLLALEDD